MSLYCLKLSVMLHCPEDQDYIYNLILSGMLPGQSIRQSGALPCFFSALKGCFCPLNGTKAQMCGHLQPECTFEKQLYCNVIYILCRSPT